MPNHPTSVVVSLVLGVVIVLFIIFCVALWAINLSQAVTAVEGKMDYVAHEMAIINGKIDKYHLLGDGK